MPPEAAPACGFPPTCLIETAEGPVPMSETPNKGFAVLTRLPSGALGFRQLIKVSSGGPVSLVRLVLDSGHAFVVGAAHPVYRLGLEAVPAQELRPGDALESAFRYPEGYVPPDLSDTPQLGPVRVTRVEPAGAGEVMRGTVRDTHVLYITAGILCGE